jgi:succinylglutamic semialdehyde dehydrogenase
MTIQSPSDLKDVVYRGHGSFAHVDQACFAARAAFKTWSHLPFEDRRTHLLRLKEVFAAHEAPWAEIISRETGKPLWEAKIEARTMVNKIDITLNESMKLIAEQKIDNIMPGTTGYLRFKPRGVMAVVGPFNFPGHLPNGHIIPALAAGNTVIFKPSDKTPAVAQFMAELYHKADFPAGVFNVVQGFGETGKRLSIHDQVDGVLFTGSYEVGLKIKQDTIHHFGKILALEMGGKNATIVWDDCDIDKAVYETLVGSFWTAGQRCSGTSRILLHQKIYDQFLDRFHKAAKKVAIGHWQDPVFMGPLISSDAVEKFLRFQEIAKREGCESLMRGKPLELAYEGHYVTPSINIVKKFDEKSVYQKSEIFGPNVAVYQVSDMDEALTINNSAGFGLVVSVFTKQRALYERCLLDAKVGLVNWNRTTNGASSRLPFGGMLKSGNDRPSGHFAIQYCAVPVSSLEDMGPFDPQQMMPGLEI